MFPTSNCTKFLHRGKVLAMEKSNQICLSETRNMTALKLYMNSDWIVSCQCFLFLYGHNHRTKFNIEP